VAAAILFSEILRGSGSSERYGERGARGVSTLDFSRQKIYLKFLNVAAAKGRIGTIKSILCLQWAMARTMWYVTIYVNVRPKVH